jgi:hypothetical protein
MVNQWDSELLYTKYQMYIIQEDTNTGIYIAFSPNAIKTTSNQPRRLDPVAGSLLRSPVMSERRVKEN